ncbi:hemagglutinin [Enterobacter cloacae]|nr:hemagglutinin [Enterobacter cloacae]
MGSEGRPYGTVKVFNSQKLTDKQIHNYAQELAGGKKLEQVRQGVFNAKLGDGSSITLRDISSSKEISGARWTIDISGNSTLKNIAPKYKDVEVKFK